MRPVQIILFKNVRFGAEPERFGAPSFPNWTDSSVHKESNPKSLSCIQINRSETRKPPGGRNPIGDEAPNATEREDCLFLDLYVPKSAVSGGAPSPPPSLPVVVWIYGGAYAFGSKDQEGPLYTGRALLRASRYRSIFVVGNYRVGAFGWLAGSYMEKVGQPNAGLYDQALLFEWVQKYINLVGGDRQRVSAWGESAGAGSILLHLIRGEGVHDPQFQTFFAQSPAFEWSWDNSAGGRLDRTFKQFSELAGCGSQLDIDCLRKATNETLRQANQELYNVVSQTGLFPVGPAVDGKWIKSIPAVTLSQSRSD